MQITVEIKDGANAEGIARALRFQANLIDGMDPKKAASNKFTSSPVKKAAKPAEDDADEDDADEDTDSDDTDTDDAEDTDSDDDSGDADADDSDSDDAEEAEEEESPKKTAKGKGPTLKDVNAALKARAEKTSFAKAKVWLKKKFKVESINDVKPAQYAALIKQAKVLNA